MDNRFELFTTQIAKISRNIHKIKSEEMAEFNLKSPHVSCLYYLFKNNGSLTAKQLCDICDEDKAAISRSIDYLERSGYISCESKTEKRYKSPLFLTKKGKQTSLLISNKIDNILIRASDGLSEENRELFYKNLLLISNNLQNITNNYGEK